MTHRIERLKSVAGVVAGAATAIGIIAAGVAAGGEPKAASTPPSVGKPAVARLAPAPTRSDGSSLNVQPVIGSADEAIAQARHAYQGQLSNIGRSSAKRVLASDLVNDPTFGSEARMWLAASHNGDRYVWVVAMTADFSVNFRGPSEDGFRSIVMAMGAGNDGEDALSALSATPEQWPTYFDAFPDRQAG